ncbi:MerR family DNA-binding transcriptional regulator [Paraferrimonas sp. SM1919]|uniref:MerR family transcriptional regulator n=1 Tax=Paraferrimonas sp. SM1919 TaxID=2662263 RepID=UPI0013CF9A72|nr:MerR family DNA-binding transcriptional regulator [Paraferrimonas sp. SM1919]
MSRYSISDLAKEFDITTRTIRFYEDKGLLSPQRKDQTRIYNSADRVRLKLILRGKRLGLSLDESREIIEMYDHSGNNIEQLQTLIAKIEQRRQNLLQQLNDIEISLLELDEVEARCKEAINQVS